MMGHIAKFREKLAAGRVCLGTAVTYTDPAVVETLCDSVDFLWLDLEHSPTSLESLLTHLIAARAGGAPALVRVPSSETAMIKRVLDQGAEGIIVPQVRSADEVRQVVNACRYPPVGTRGFGPRRPSNYGRERSEEFTTKANQTIFVVIQIETADAVRNLDAILAVPGIDSIVLGPNDLSGALGLMGQTNHPKVMETLGMIIDKTRKAGLHVGTGGAASEDYAVAAVKMGVRWIQSGGDFGYLVAYADQLFGRIRKRLEQ